VSLASTGRDGTQDNHSSLAKLLEEKKKASGSTARGDGDVAGCDADTCDKCKHAPVSAAKAEEVALKNYMDSLAAVDVYKAKNPEVAGLSNEQVRATCSISVLLRVRTRPKLRRWRVMMQRTSSHSARTLRNNYVAIVAAHDAEKHLKKFIAEKKIEEYEADNPSISDYTDGTCPGTAELENYSTIDCFGLDHCSTRCAAAECC
jgi:hypothetical protein